MSLAHNGSLNVDKLSLEETDIYISKVEALLGQLVDHKQTKSSQNYSLEVFSKEYLDFLGGHSAVKYVKSVKVTLDKAISYFGGDKLITSMTRAEADKFIASLKVSAPKGYPVYYRNLKAAFNVALHWKYIDDNPFAMVKLPKKQKVLPAYITPEQLDLILEKTEDKTLCDIFHFAFYTGCRRSEILNVKWENIDFQKRTITIGDDSFQTKTKKQRFIPMCEELYSRLWDRSGKGAKITSKPNEIVFAKPNGFSFHEDTPTKAFKKSCRAANIDEKIHFHSLRHSFASYLVQNGSDIYSVQKLLGHSSITTTEIYAQLNIDSLQESIKAFDGIKKNCSVTENVAV